MFSLHPNPGAERALLRNSFVLMLAFVVVPKLWAQPNERFVVNLEWGAAWQGRNNVESPNNDSATRFAFDQLTGSGPYSAPRVELAVPIANRRELRFVAAPFRINESGVLNSPVTFEGANFNAGATSATYRFDSYRATWRQTVGEWGDWTFKAGVTGKIRDAEITLRQGTQTATRSDTGFVPLLHAYVERKFSHQSRLVIDGDGLAGGPGYALDLSLRYVRDLQPGLSAFGGVRLLDGGVDNNSVYNFARFYYLTFGLQFRGFDR
ncbi:MAG: hypothetical protein FGM18_09990 [Burkholderiaceae bacterium]|nr:hypothetical protein [Burkholderiaceae bacterium]